MTRQAVAIRRSIQEEELKEMVKKKPITPTIRKNKFVKEAINRIVV